MAKKGNGKSQKATETEIPEGFGINVGRERGDGWAKKEQGNEILGRLMGRYTYQNRGKKRAYYQVKLLKECTVEVENPEWTEDSDEDVPSHLTAEAKIGQIVNVDETAKLADLEPFTKNGGVYDLWFVYEDKIDIGNGQTMWSIKGPRLRMVAKPSEVPQDHVPF